MEEGSARKMETVTLALACSSDCACCLWWTPRDHGFFNFALQIGYIFHLFPPHIHFNFSAASVQASLHVSRVHRERHAEGAAYEISPSFLSLPLCKNLHQQLKCMHAHRIFWCILRRKLWGLDMTPKKIQHQNQHSASAAAATTRSPGRKGRHFGELVMFIARHCARLEHIYPFSDLYF